MFRSLQVVVVFIAFAGIVSSPLVSAAQEAAARRRSPLRIHDVQLGDDENLVGAVVDSKGMPLRKMEVTIERATPRSQGATPASSNAHQATTDDHGLFRVRLTKGGIYRISTKTGVTLVRAWKHGTAPPAASKEVLIVNTSEDIVRGQRPISDLFHINDPVLVATLTAAAIAIPVAVHNSRDDSKSGS